MEGVEYLAARILPYCAAVAQLARGWYPRAWARFASRQPADGLARPSGAGDQAAHAIL